MATLSRMAKKAAFSSVIQLANRTPHRNYTSAMFTTPLKTSTSIRASNINFNQFRTTLIPSHHHFSSLAVTKSNSDVKKSNSDATLLEDIKSEIDYVEEVLETPTDFPFEILDGPWMKDFIILTREYEGEKINAIVKWPFYVEEGYRYRGHLSLFLNIRVSKRWGPTLKFTEVSAKADGIKMTGHFRVKNPYTLFLTSKKSPEFSILDEKLTKDLKTYLEDRGLKPSNTKFLCDYMVKKKERKYTQTFKSLNNFIGNETGEFELPMVSFCRDVISIPKRMVWSIYIVIKHYVL